jgi:predicted nucleic acid-binding protein
LKILLDTSLLIAAFVESHPKHKEAFKVLTNAKKKEFEFFISAHTILEVYSVLTSAPFKPPITTEIAEKLIENNIRSIAKIISLTDKDYFNIVKKMSDNNFKGGIVYDGIIVECALNEGVDEIVTLNSKDFLRLIGNNSIKIRTV